MYAIEPSSGQEHRIRRSRLSVTVLVATLLLGTAILPAGAQAQAGGANPALRPGKPWRVLVGAPKLPADAVIARLAASGYLEGQNIVYERVVPGPAFATDLATLAQRVGAFDAAVAVMNPAVRAVNLAFPKVPVVSWTHDAVRSGLVASMARPGGMVTGMDSRAPEQVAKRLELLKLLMPQARSLAVVYGPIDESSRFHLQTLREAAATRGLALVPLEVNGPADAERLFALREPKPADAAIVVTDFGTSGRIQTILRTARERQVPSLCEFRAFVAWGCTMSYGSTFGEFAETAARQLDRLFRGARVGDIPMEYPTRYELVLHSGQIKALGLALPRELRLRADELIE
jgi:putative tryptophan/tyrosine transport system substrate-binding protein